MAQDWIDFVDGPHTLPFSINIRIIRRIDESTWSFNNIEDPNSECCFAIYHPSDSQYYILYNGDKWQGIMSCFTASGVILRRCGLYYAKLTNLDKQILDDLVESYCSNI